MRVGEGAVLVVGLGASGRAAADFLIGLRDGGTALEIHARDEADTDALREAASRLAEAGVDVRLGTADGSGEWDLVVASPGVPPTSALLESASQAAAAVVSEIELAQAHSRSPFVAVTGTNGKTTTTSLVTHLLRAAGIGAESIGNIDPPALAVSPVADADTVMVCEASSFALAHIRDFHPEVSVFLNITPDHLDWHGSLERYRADKARIFENQCGSDLAIVVTDDPGAAALVDRVRARGIRLCEVSLDEMRPGGASVVDDVLTLSGPEGPVPLVAVEELAIGGPHNVTNALAAAAAAVEMGAEPGLVAAGLRSFAPLAHRLESVGVIGGVEYIDDSKATNPDAVVKAVETFADRAIVLMLGGRNKDFTFSGLGSMLPGRVRTVVAFGESADDVVRDLDDRVTVTRAPGLVDAFAAAAGASLPGDVVLLSPGCASFDEFSGYAARGDAFAALVRERAEEAG